MVSSHEIFQLIDKSRYVIELSLILGWAVVTKLYLLSMMLETIKFVLYACKTPSGTLKEEHRLKVFNFKCGRQQRK